jgi:hypothetical protein
MAREGQASSARLADLLRASAATVECPRLAAWLKRLADGDRDRQAKT